MLHIKIVDLPRDKMVSKEDMRKIRGGSYPAEYYEQNVNKAKSGGEAARELWKRALRTLKEVEERKSDLISKMAQF
jgi:hypothetical protein